MRTKLFDGKRYVLAASTQEGVKWDVKKFKAKRHPKEKIKREKNAPVDSLGCSGLIQSPPKVSEPNITQINQNKPLL